MDMPSSTNRGPGTASEGIPGAVRFIADRFQGCQYHVGRFMQSVHRGAENVIRNELESYGIQADIPQRKRRRGQPMLASLSLGSTHVHNRWGRAFNVVLEGLASQGENKQIPNKVKATFPTVRREDEERFLISEVSCGSRIGYSLSFSRFPLSFIPSPVILSNIRSKSKK
jgi:hypothetical protein